GRSRASVVLGASTAEIEAGKLRDAHITDARLAIDLGEQSPAPAPSQVVAPEPPPLQNGHKKGSKSAPEPFHPIIEMPNLHAFRAMIQNAGQHLADRVPDGLHVALDALGVDLKRGNEKLELGPGKVTALRRGNEMALDFSAGTGQTPL